MKVGANNVFPITYDDNTLNRLVEIESLGNTIQAKISPNPFKEEINISLSSKSPIQGVIYNALSEEVLIFEIFGETAIQTANLKQGAYFVKLGDNFSSKNNQGKLIFTAKADCKTRKQCLIIKKMLN